MSASVQLAIDGLDEEAAPASTRTYGDWNRLVKVTGSTTVAEYEYDARDIPTGTSPAGLNHRIVKSNGTGTVKDHFYCNEDWQELEVRKETSGTISANPFEQFVWHPYYIDALATRFYDATVGGTQVQHYFTHDANFNVTSAISTTASVVERYDYSPYGEPLVYLPSFDFDADGQSDIANSRRYTGQRLDPETGLYQYRNRYYHAKLGRFISRDPIGYEGSQWNLYEYVGGRPEDLTDATGLTPNEGRWIMCGGRMQFCPPNHGCYDGVIKPVPPDPEPAPMTCEEACAATFKVLTVACFGNFLICVGRAPNQVNAAWCAAQQVVCLASAAGVYSICMERCKCEKGQ
ncbi:RHS repeat-associated core domain-containing protein [bacterium]|nr:RHS repeat-associated core domain-containing protein [bacterium]